MDRVSDPADPRLADYRDLTDVALRQKVEPAHGIFIAEGELVIRRALLAGYPLRSALMSPRWYAVLDDVIRDAAETAGAQVLVADDDVLEQVTGFHVHRGALAVFARKPLPTPDDVLADARRVVVLDQVNNPTNLGAIVRSAAGLGMDAVLLDPRSVDHLYRRSVRVSMGEVFALPIARLSPPWPKGLDVLRSNGFRVLALTPSSDAAPIDALQPEPDERIALVLGAEGPGLAPSVLDYADAAVRIPMSRDVDSLNVGAAAAVAFYALGRR